ncbi:MULTISPECIES: bifunctional diguanylate cyclase/phosphodiesterase [unclassified Caballeronia]|uniref:putative bifunctional diguanylate cyclase/phosphodiesterase n=1 Tax=unclassified Caballeronia TaxID=2646786 RepID=UPI0013EC2E3D|nr:MULTISPECIES: EAL domain-containing protein [unclassified Caballeronia]
MDRAGTARWTRYSLFDALAIIVAGSTGCALLLLHFSIASTAIVVLSELSVAYLGFRLRHLESKAAITDGLSRVLLSTDEDCLKLLDRNGRIACISEVGQRLMRAQSEDQLVGKNWLGFWSTPDADIAFRTAMSGQLAAFSGCCESLEGELKWWRSTLAPVLTKDGTVIAALCTSREITGEMALLNKLQNTATVQRDMEDHVDAVFWTASADFEHLHHVSSGFERMWEMPLSALSQDKTAWAHRVHPEDLPILREQMRSAMREKVGAQAYFRLIFGGGRTKWVRADVCPVIDKGSVKRIVSVCVDATSERQRLQELERIARADDLTGLYNRNAMLEALASSCAGGQPFAFLFIDLDKFKVVNDTEGHSTGDDVLKVLGDRIRKSLPDDATVARPGGDEFTVILPGCWDVKSIEPVYKRLIACCRRPITAGGHAITMTFSVGASIFPEHGETPEALFTSADLAMYAAKRSGRNTFRMFGAQEKGDLTRAHLENELREAIGLKQFVLYFQPQFCTRTRTLQGVEALIRWNHPSRGLIAPKVFVSVLEESELIVKAGHWVIRKAIAALATIDSGTVGSVSMSINVSPKQFKDSRLVPVLRDALRKHGISGSRLVVEITESTLMEDIERAQGVLDGLRGLGLRVAIDDFGIGYSSLSYLTKFRPDVLKLDKSLLDDVVIDEAARTVVEGVIELAHKLGIAVVAEGVETEDQMSILAAANCDEIQGFLLGRPLPLDALMALVKVAAPTDA